MIPVAKFSFVGSGSRSMYLSFHCSGHCLNTEIAEGERRRSRPLTLTLALPLISTRACVAHCRTTTRGRTDAHATAVSTVAALASCMRNQDLMDDRSSRAQRARATWK